jgi:uncharacterized DUF497 family protein
VLKRLTIKKNELVWDEWNIKHIAKHNVTKLEVEEVFAKTVRAKRSYKGRLVVFGKTKKKRLLAVVLEKEKSGYYTLTARDASRKERRDLLK